MRFEFIREHAATWPIRLMCRVLQVSASGYYAWRVRPDSARRVANRHLLGDIWDSPVSVDSDSAYARGVHRCPKLVQFI